MAYIDTKNDFPGIVGLLYFKPSTGKAASTFAQAVLRGPSPLTPGEREQIATYVSGLNQCSFCRDSHAAATKSLSPSEEVLVDSLVAGKVPDSLSPKMKALLDIAGKVQKSGSAVTARDIAAARQAGADDEAIHDAVMVAAAFCFFNRYVDGLGTQVPKNTAWYQESGEFLAKMGYKGPTWIGRFFMNRMQKKYEGGRTAG